MDFIRHEVVTELHPPSSNQNQHHYLNYCGKIHVFESPFRTQIALMRARLHQSQVNKRPWLSRQKKKSLTHICFFLFFYRSNSVAGTHKGAISLQHPFKDPAAACRHQGRQAASEGDETRERVSYHIRLWPRNGCWDPEAGVWTFLFLCHYTSVCVCVY